MCTGYLPNANPTTAYESCGNATDEDFACCNTPDDICLQNGLCYWQTHGTFFLNGCTGKVTLGFIFGDIFRLLVPDLDWVCWLIR